ncbi:hypothetical protein FNO01nite_24790 [Flavobacterium noncentrifugens]|uniref:Uncharacterized protein n=1 Tax=Flavobacterium noncentrifugens TaxID=1128970 RepID=A0A1G8ZYD2_9FLAO|nr:hypothetical protein [Flavobacterium noncentrifugens]GEP51807.1 hypothetical protein FNO01nite_24790 [Flavobacterium noncentrifugens]SDK19345.1 hypothetical protein SAMN04487935_2769 [Flavobacterium noncentrifugens]
MKRVFLAYALLFAIILNAQELMDVMAKESCECVMAKNLDLKNISSEKLQLEFGTCVVQSYTTHKEAYDKISKTDFSDKDSMRKLGQDVALKMFSICPDVLMALANDNASENSTAESPKIEGEISDFVTNEFVTIKVKDKNNRLHNLILLDYFDTASLYTDGLIRKKDKVIMSYSEVELFDPKSKEFRYYKVITGIEKK